ncbi:hypothetical protein DICVIV_04288 [Dictyocaulus viviparus]|uniref:OCIA domain-containing protein n=1 Tax=Dictyocaulus viviparus TaxID=29172 RepID=A0A0D8Y094_DICVI|nr:hypothetical protein DICVIV_04288 [Dictyocaulus viviparus]
MQLTAEELQMLLNKMSSDERNELSKALETCTREVTVTRGIPITAAVLGSLYYARKRLPSQYHYGPKGWPFYAIMGIASLTTVNVLSMGRCRDRVNPMVMQMYQKYNIGRAATTHEDMRWQNRQQQGYQSKDYTGITTQQPGFDYTHIPPDRSTKDSYGFDTSTIPTLSGTRTDDTTNYGQTFDLTPERDSTDFQRRQAPPYGYMYRDDTPSYMSGTPTSPRISNPPSEFSR